MLHTIAQARAPSTRRLYAQKWSVFVDWCSARNEDPVECDVSPILSFLQERLDKGLTPSKLKVYVAAISAFHAPIAGQSVGRNSLIVHFLRGSRRLKPPRPLTVPTWDLHTVLGALKGPPFEPLRSADLRPLTLKTALLLALASVKRDGDLQALSVSPACLEFGPNDSKVKSGHLSQPFRQSDQLFVCFGGRTKGSSVSKQRLSRWIVEAIALCYSSMGLECPIGVRAHSTRGMASSWAWSSGVSIKDICEAAGWSSPSTFVRFYNLDIPTLHARVHSV